MPQQDQEDTPLLLGVSDRYYDRKKLFNKCSKWSCFYFFCFLSGQYINVDITKSYFKKVISVAGLFLFIVQIIFYLGHVVTAVAIGVCRIANVATSNITLVSFTENCTNSCPSSTINCTTDCMINCTLPQEHWKYSTATTIGSLAAFLSYGLITCLILIPTNVIPCSLKNAQTRIGRFCKSCCNIFYRRALKNSILSPFDDSEELSVVDIVYFYTNYLFVYILFFFCLVSSIWYRVAVYNQKDSNNQTLYNYGSCWINQLNVARIAFHLISQFCSIQSCFIFSKIVYKVTNKMKKLSENCTVLLDFGQNPNITEIEQDTELKGLLLSDNREKVDKGRYNWLQKMDRDFIKEVEPTLDLYGIWFIFHCIPFALTTMLLTGYILQILIYVAENSVKTILNTNLIPDASTDSEPAIIWSYALNIVFFTLIHAYLFLYPCFCASAIATARTKLIHKISKKRWVNVTPSLQNSFTQYLTAQNFTFRVPLFCATISFEFNWVYVSFFIAICGTYLKIQ